MFCVKVILISCLFCLLTDLVVTSDDDDDIEDFEIGSRALSLKSVDSQCQTPTKQPGTCQRLKSCPELLQLYNNRKQNPQAINHLKQSKCGRDSAQRILLCCPNQNTGDESLVPIHPALPSYTDCGIHESNRRIWGGRKTDLDEFPWLVLIAYKHESEPKAQFGCGGSLIGKRFVLTAAHCVTGSGVEDLGEPIAVRFGEYNTSESIDCLPKQGCNDKPVNIRIEKVIPHPNYDELDRNKQNDIALVKLKRDVPYTNFIRPICLLNKGKTVQFQGSEHLWVAGWGTTETGEKSDVKLKLKVPPVPFDSCSSIYTKKGKINLDETRQRCAGGEKEKDSCDGDSGGPLMALYSDQNEETKWFCTAVVSFGPVPCGRKGIPGVYTRVDNYIDWILSNLK